jgi:hypothetical protein
MRHHSLRKAVAGFAQHALEADIASERVQRPLSSFICGRDHGRIDCVVRATGLRSVALDFLG